MILTGNSLSNNVGSAAGEDTQFLVYGSSTGLDATQTSASILRLDGLKAAIALPAGLPAWSTYLIWPANSTGYGYPIAVNRTQGWWVGPDQAAGGATVSVYGRNLSHGNGTANSWVYIKTSGAAGQWATTTSVNPYRVQFTVPSSLAPGTYEIWVHNGHGGSYGWSGPLSLTVTAPYSWNGGTFNVRNYGAKGDGVTDDTGAINAAYNAAVVESQQTALHPTLYFPAGTYMMNHGIGFYSNVRYLGDGMNLTFLKCNAQFSQLPSPGDKLGLMFTNGGVTQNVEVNGLTLDANGNFGAPGNEDHLVFCQCAAGSSDFHFINVRLQILLPGFGCSFITNVTRLSYVGCTFIGGDVMSFEGTQHSISGCSFFGANDSPMSIIQRGTSELSISGCHAANYDDNSPTGQGQGRFLAANGNYGTQSNVYVGGNTTVNCGPRAGAADQNSGEHVLCEGNDNLYEGNPCCRHGDDGQVQQSRLRLYRPNRDHHQRPGPGAVSVDQRLHFRHDDDYGQPGLETYRPGFDQRRRYRRNRQPVGGLSKCPGREGTPTPATPAR